MKAISLICLHFINTMKNNSNQKVKLFKKSLNIYNILY